MRRTDTTDWQIGAKDGEPEAGAAGDVREGAGFVAGEVLRSENAALSREAQRGTRDGVELHVGADGLARGGLGLEDKQARDAPEETSAGPMAGMLLPTDGSKHCWLPAGGTA